VQVFDQSTLFKNICLSGTEWQEQDNTFLLDFFSRSVRHIVIKYCSIMQGFCSHFTPLPSRQISTPKKVPKNVFLGISFVTYTTG
jgi:hypothetical protein